MEKQNSCVLKLEHLIFDELHFDRKGFQNKNSIQYEFGFNFEMRGKTELIAHILLQGEKPEEYSVLVRASGYFVLDENSEYDRLTLRQKCGSRRECPGSKASCPTPLTPRWRLWKTASDIS